MSSFADFETNFGGIDAASPANADQRRRIRERAFRAGLPTQGLDQGRFAGDDAIAATRKYRKLEKAAGA
jgi:hypothetical protein